MEICKWRWFPVTRTVHKIAFSSLAIISFLYSILLSSGTFDHRAGGACPEDCHTTQYTAQLSYARYVSRPPIGSAAIKIPKRFEEANLTYTELETVIR